MHNWLFCRWCHKSKWKCSSYIIQHTRAKGIVNHELLIVVLIAYTVFQLAIQLSTILPRMTDRVFISLQQIFTLTTKWDRHLLVEDSSSFITCDASSEFWWQLMMHKALYCAFHFVIVCPTHSLNGTRHFTRPAIILGR